MRDFVNLEDFLAPLLPSAPVAQSKVFPFQLESDQFLFLTWEECGGHCKAPVPLSHSPALILAFNIIMKDAL